MPSTYTNLLYHIVFSTRHRQPFIEPELQSELYPYLGGAIRDEGGILLERGGIADHLHLLVKLPATVALSNFVRGIKSNSSGLIHKRPEFNPAFAWQTGYAAFTVSKSQVPMISAYIQNQEKHHRKQSFKTELLALLEKNEIEFDERYLWD